MTISFQASNADPELSCGVCREPLIQDVVIHNNDDGEKHPFHKNCVREWMKIDPTCPVCRVNIDPSSIFSWQDKVTSVWNRCKNYKRPTAEILGGIGMGIVMGALGTIQHTEDGLGRPVLVIKLTKLALTLIPSTFAGITAASLVRIQNAEVALLASSFTTFMLYNAL